MAHSWETLQSIINPHVSPIRRFEFKGKAGTDQCFFVAGHYDNGLIKIPNVWELLSFSLDISTDATVANRYPIIGVKNADNSQIYEPVVSTFITASQNIPVHGGGWSLFSNMTPASGTVYYCGFTKRHYNLFAGDEQWRVQIINGQAGDSYDLRVSFRSLNIELGILEKLKEIKPKPWWC